MPAPIPRASLPTPSVALAIVESTVKALVEAGATVETTNPTDTIETLREGAQGAKHANVAVQAMQSGDSYAEGKAFSAGSRAAVGATVAVSLMSSDVLAALRADTTNAAGSVRVYALTKNTDEVNAVATSIGASLDRVLEKFRLGLNYVSPGAGPSNLSGQDRHCPQRKGHAPGRQVHEHPQAGQRFPAAFEQHLRVFNVDLDAGHRACHNAGLVGNRRCGCAERQRGAAAADCRQIRHAQRLPPPSALPITPTRHGGNHRKGHLGGDVEAHAENRANFRTRATGATVTSAAIANVVGTAAAITINRNGAEATVSGNVEAEGDLDVSAATTQNLDGNYVAYLARRLLLRPSPPVRAARSTSRALLPCSPHRHRPWQRSRKMLLSRPKTSLSPRRI